MLDAQSKAEVDALTAELIDEFAKHWREYQAQYPNADRRIAFEGWMIQKIAALQWTALAMWRRSGSPDLRKTTNPF